MRRLTPLLLVVLAVACFAGVTRLQPTIVEMRRDLRLDQAEPTENMPPLIAFTTVALGGFRGIIADVLWLRASSLQEQGKYFELVQLADWITKLEPRFALIWAFQGWNMAYNVSVLFNSPEDRWRWVENGIKLLRDQGMFYNKGDARLYRELGWIYQHKVGGSSDQAHLFYKRRLAEEMMTLFDGPRPDYKECDAAAKTREDLLKRPGVEALVDEIKAMGQDPFSVSLMGTNQPANVSRLLQSNPASHELIAYLRVKRMKEDYKLDPAIMEQVDAEYGPLDWRSPQAHAIYWAFLGLQYTRGPEDNEKVACDRMIFQSMADAFFQGKAFINPAEDAFIPTPNLALLPRVRKAYEEAIEAYPDQSAMQSAYRNFLRNAILILYTYHRNADARELFRIVKERYPADDTTRDLRHFVYQNYARYVGELSPREAMGVVEGALTQSYMWLGLGDSERAAGFLQLAQVCWSKYMENKMDPEMRERSGLPPLEVLRKQALERFREAFRSKEALERLKAPPPTSSEAMP